MCFLESLCVLARLSALCHIVTCFFVVVVHFSLVTTLFCFISLDTLLGNFFCGCIECLCVCFLASLCILVRLFASCHVATCFFVDVVDFSLVTTLFCFISLDTILGNFFVVVLSVYVCVFLCLSVICNF